MSTLTEHAAALRQRLSGDPTRPTYHFLPPAYWMNDPNGLIHWNGQYHLFYQHNPYSAAHANMHWGHAVSTDLIHWKDLPVALTPTPGGPDEGGCWSGCAVNHDGVPTLIYTGVLGNRGELQQAQCIATSHDELLTWEKYDGNPVIATVPAEAKQTRDFRDPFVWREGETWYMVLGSRIGEAEPAVFLYQSDDLYQWQYLNPLIVGSQPGHGVIWECPNFFRLGDQWVLIVSAHTGTSTGRVLYFVGSFDGQRFTPESEGTLDYGYLYAPLTILDEAGRRLMWGWLREGRPVEAQVAADWSGVQSIPRELSLLPDGRLGMQPVPELEAIRGRHHHTDQMALSDNFEMDFDGTALEIIAEFQPGETGEFGLTLTTARDGSEYTRILYNVVAQQIIVDRAHASADATVDAWANMAHCELAPGETLRLHILLDASVIEIIANQRTSVTSRIYPTRAEGLRLTLFSRQSEASLQSLDSWEMQSIWPS